MNVQIDPHQRKLRIKGYEVKNQEKKREERRERREPATMLIKNND